MMDSGYRSRDLVEGCASVLSIRGTPPRPLGPQEQQDSEATSYYCMQVCRTWFATLVGPASFVCIPPCDYCWTIEKQLGASLHVAQTQIAESAIKPPAGIPSVQKPIRRKTPHAYVLEFKSLDPRIANTTGPTTPT